MTGAWKPAAQVAREKKGLTPAQAGKRINRSARYVRSLELHGRTPYHLAQRLASLYDCPMSVFEQPTKVLVIRVGGLTLENAAPPDASFSNSPISDSFSRTGGQSVRLKLERKGGATKEYSRRHGTGRASAKATRPNPKPSHPCEKQL